jgi:hypothetical protein
LPPPPPTPMTLMTAFCPHESSNSNMLSPPRKTVLKNNSRNPR